MDNIKKKLREDINETLRNYIDERVKQALSKSYIGKVIDNNDPEKLQRCKIRVYGIFGNEIPDDDLPWALPDQSFIGSLIGSVIIPPIDAIVRVYFDNGDVYTPIYTSKVFDGKNMSSEAGDNYPETMVFFETDAGEYFKINRETGETTYKHSSGLIFTIDKDGNTELNIEEATTGNLDIKIKGNVTINSDGNVEVKSKGDATIESSTGNITIKSATGQIKLDTVDSAVWAPNILPVCLFTGAPHGGSGAGISNLKGK